MKERGAAEAPPIFYSEGGGSVAHNDYQIMSGEDLDAFLFTPFQQAIGKETSERVRSQVDNYHYYDGYQHLKDGKLVKPQDLERPAGLDYDPTRFYTNYFKTFIQRKARWQMGGKHSIHVEPKQLDAHEDRIQADYAPSAAQLAENKRAEEAEKLLNQLWKENKMREKLLSAAKDRLIAGRVGCKIAFNPLTGKIKWVFRPDTEIFPVYSDDDFEEMIGCHFVQLRKDAKDKVEIWKQTFRMESGSCWIEEAIFSEKLELIRSIQPKTNMMIDFIPVVLFPVSDLTGQDVRNTEVEDIRQITDILNKMNEDAIDSLKFEMFPMTALINVPEGTAEKVNVAPGAMIEAQTTGMGENVKADIKKVESGFKWTQAYGEQFSRLKAALHEVTSIPNIVPQELNFGGLNADALQVMFHSIIQETEEHWMIWGARLTELHEKTIRYLQARTGRGLFAYDPHVLSMIGTDYENEVQFALPLPDNRKDLVELLAIEVASGFESAKGAIARLGHENVQQKTAEIQAEKAAQMAAADPYGGAGTEVPGGDPQPGADE